MKTNINYLNFEEILDVISSHQYFVIDSIVYSLYPKIVEKMGKKPFFILADAEKNKNIQKYELINDFFINHNIDRSSKILVIGGGATSDLAGFVASTILRGIDWEIIPTTFLSMIDAAIGGKTGINTIHGKNLIGSFHLPKKIYLNLDFIKTQSKKEIDSGKGELIKYCFLDKKIAELVLDQAPIDKIVDTCANYKNKIVAEDFKEEGKRILLNLGHTLGHAIEKTHSYSHGVSVFIGLRLIHQIYGIQKIVDLCDEFAKKLDLNINFELDKNKLIDFVLKDKKRKGDRIKILLVQEIGLVEIIEMNVNDLIGKLKS